MEAGIQTEKKGRPFITAALFQLQSKFDLSFDNLLILVVDLRAQLGG
jgi:hypothetical protein